MLSELTDENIVELNKKEIKILDQDRLKLYCSEIATAV
jgi:hypothetical protein